MRDEKFYKVRAESGLYAQYFDWVDSREKVVEVLKKFEQENGFEAGSTAAWASNFYLKSTSPDFLKYADQLTKQSVDGGLTFRFKKSSNIGKLWAAASKDLRFLPKPIVGFYNNAMCVGGSSSRIFDHHGELYCSIEADKIDMPENIFVEMKGSEFYKIIELKDQEEGVGSGRV